MADLIKKVVSIDEPDIIIKNPTPRSEKDFIAAKKLDNEKMGEVGLRKDENITKIFHANEKRIRNLDLLAKKEIVVDGRNAHTSYTQAQSLDGRLVENNISSTTKDVISQNPQENSKNSQIDKPLSEADKKAKQKEAAMRAKQKQELKSKTQEIKKDKGFDR